MKEILDFDNHYEVFNIFLLSRLVESAPRITVHTLDTIDSCTHEVALPPGQEYTALRKPPGEPAKTYPFTLDAFQEEVIS